MTRKLEPIPPFPRPPDEPKPREMLEHTRAVQATLLDTLGRMNFALNRAVLQSEENASLIQFSDKELLTTKISNIDLNLTNLNVTDANFNARNDRDASTPVTPVIATDGTAIDHTVNTDGSVDISFEWSWSGQEKDIDGFVVFEHASTASTPYVFGTTPQAETTHVVRPDKRALILRGVAANLNYTFGVLAFRVVDPDIDPGQVKESPLVQATGAGEDPFLPSASVAFAGDVTGTIDQGRVSATGVNVWADISGAGKPENNADVTGAHAADIDVLLTQNAPAEAGANVTETRTAAAIAGQGALATKSSVDLATGEVVNKTADNISESASRKWAGETGADVTATRVPHPLNANFEAGTDGWPVLAGWVIANDPANAHQGNWVASYAGTTAALRNQFGDGTPGGLPAAEGDRFLVGGFVKTSANAAFGTAGWRVSWRDASGTEIGSDGTTSTSVPPASLNAASTTYTRVRKAVTAPANTAFAVLEGVVFSRTAGTIYIDDGMLVPIPQEPDLDALLLINAPAEAGANVTETRTAMAIIGQGLLATRNAVDLATTEVLNKTADNIAESVTRKWAAESGADITTGKDLSVLIGRTADKITYIEGGTVDSLRPAASGADVTAKKVTATINADFESGDADWTAQAGWTIENDSANAKKGEWVGKFTGQASGRLKNDATFQTALLTLEDGLTLLTLEDGVTVLQAEGLPGGLPAAENDRFMVGGWIKTTSGAAFGAASFGVSWRDLNGMEISRSGPSLAAASTAYTQVRSVETAPAGAAFAVLDAEVTGWTAGTIYIDDGFLLPIPKSADIDALATTNAPAEAGATLGADWATNVTARPVELTDGRVAAALLSGSRLSDAVRQDAGGVIRSLPAGKASGMAFDGDAVTFSQTWDAPPSIAFGGRSGGGKGASSTQNLIQQATDLSVSGFTAFLKLRDLVTTTTAQSDGPGANVGGTPAWQIEKNAAAGEDINDTYSYNFAVTVNDGPGGEPGSVVIGFYTRKTLNGAWTKTGETSYFNTGTNFRDVVADGMGIDAAFGIHVELAIGASGIDLFTSVTYETATGFAEETATPAGAAAIGYDVIGNEDAV